MNYPSRTDNTLEHEDWNQNPPSLPADATTHQDLNGLSNSRVSHDHKDEAATAVDKLSGIQLKTDSSSPELTMHRRGPGLDTSDPTGSKTYPAPPLRKKYGLPAFSSATRAAGNNIPHQLNNLGKRISPAVLKFGEFIGPGFLISVAYIDPGNYSTDVAAGSSTKFKLLFVVLMSNVFAIFLQSLCIKLGSVTGLNLAENCRAHLPRWLNWFLYLLAEGAIIATDIAEVIGSAIALNLLLRIPLIAGCAITLVDVLVILFFYRPAGSMKGLRAFEWFVAALVLAVVICFCIQLSYIQNTGVGEVFKGYLPNSAVVEGNGIYLSCGILGATVMPHSLYLGSGIVQSRLRHYDMNTDYGTAEGLDETPAAYGDDDENFQKYRPSYAAIKYCLSYSIIELTLCLFTFALFVNSAILIVAGASLADNDEAQVADLFGIHALLSATLTPVAGTLFALALLFSGTSAGIVCTMAGQMVSEGAINWKFRPWLRRLLTRTLSIIPAIIVAAAVGKDGLTNALNGTQIALSVALPFVSAPLIYFTCRRRYMEVEPASDANGDRRITMQNSWYTAAFAVAIWLVMCIMNVALLVLVGLGKA